MAFNLMSGLLTTTRINYIIKNFTDFNEFDNDSDETGNFERVWFLNMDLGKTNSNKMSILTLSPAISRIFLSTDIHWFPLSPDMANTSWFWFLRVTWKIWLWMWIVFCNSTCKVYDLWEYHFVLKKSSIQCDTYPHTAHIQTIHVISESQTSISVII